MGSTNSTNIVDNSISAMISSTNTVSQVCAATSNTSQSINYQTDAGCKDANIVIGGVTMDSSATVSASCMANVNQQNTVQASIEQAAQQMATSISQSLNLNLGSTNSANIARLSTALGVSVNNAV